MGVGQEKILELRLGKIYVFERDFCIKLIGEEKMVRLSHLRRRRKNPVYSCFNLTFSFLQSIRCSLAPGVNEKCEAFLFR